MYNDRLKDDFNDVLIKMSEGNPGSLRVLFEILEAKENDIFASLEVFSTLNDMKLYGAHLYMLWNDCCGNDINKTLLVIQKYREGKITDDDINERIKNVGYGLSFDDLIK